MSILPSDIVYPDRSLLIGEKRTTGPSAHLHIFPGSGQPTGEVALAGAAEMDAAVSAARKALASWKNAPANVRRDAMLRLADLMDMHGDAIARLAVAENGLVINKTTLFRRATTDNLRYYAGWVDKIAGQVLPAWPLPAFNYTRYEPYGVIAIIIPWNVPLGVLGQIIGGAIAGGNAVVVKPAELAPLTALRFGELCLEAGIPPGVVNVVPGGPDGGEALVRHPGVDKVHFTGSGPTALKILSGIGLKPIGLELGGKSARIVFADGDLDAAARTAALGILANSGQGCLLGTRLLVEDSIYDDFLEQVLAQLQTLKVGDPFDTQSEAGPVVTEAARQRILGIIDRAVSQNEGRLLTGGRAIDGDGFFLEPTIFADVDPGSRLAQEEVFGPVLAASRFENEQEAIAIANNSSFGLGAYIHSNDYRRLNRVASQLEVGNVWANGFHVPSSSPFGGAKDSGYGRVGGEAGLHEFLRMKNVWMAL